ncbi:PmoA family protein [Algoriphagus aestuarii]|nr:PmoA family protein [Algoriphagus aestuarii]
MIIKRIILPVVVTMVLSSGVFAQKVTLRETEKGIDFLLGDQAVLTYQTATEPVPEGVKSDYAKSGFIHPLTSPSGQVLTRIQPKDHYHHYGIWGPWTRATIDGRMVDFWNLADHKGRVDFDKVIAKKEAGGVAELTVRQNHIDLGASEANKLALQEDLVIKVMPADKGRYMVDYTSNISTKLKDGILLDAYRYGGGLGYRATEMWGSDNSSVLTSEGKDRKTADGSDAKWIIIKGESKAPQGQSGLLILSHNTNKSHPEPLRIWPEENYNRLGNVFVEFTPIRHESWEILPNQRYSLKYRMIVFDGDMTAEEAENYWRAFVK